MFYNPYNHSEVWGGSFGNGMRMGIAKAAPITRTTSAVVPGRFYAHYNVGKIFIRMPAPIMQSTRLVIRSIDGKAVYTYVNVSPAASGLCTLNARCFAPGVYVLQAAESGNAKIVIPK